MWHWLGVVTGGVWRGTVPSVWYNEWSGFIGDISLIAAALAVLYHSVLNYRKGICRYRRCPRIGHYELIDPDSGVAYKMCWRHHPHVDAKTLSSDRLAQIERRLHLYLGDKPGPG